MNVMGVWFPAMKANGDSAPIDYYDEDGELIRTATEAKPLVVSYTDAAANGAHDVWAAISRDDGHTWKKKNLSRMAERSSYTRLDGYEYPGECKKPVLQVKGNKILVAWTSKYARGGKPRYTIDVCPAGMSPTALFALGTKKTKTAVRTTFTTIPTIRTISGA